MQIEKLQVVVMGEEEAVDGLAGVLEGRIEGKLEFEGC
jgi:hypothetical protein